MIVVDNPRKARKSPIGKAARNTGGLLISRVATIGSNGEFLSLTGLFSHSYIRFRTDNAQFHEMRMRLFPCDSLRFRFKVTIDHNGVSLRCVMA